MALFLANKLNGVHKISAVIIVSAVLGATVPLLGRAQGPQPKTSATVPVEPIRAEFHEVRQTLTLTGQVEPFQVATLAAQVSARVQLRHKEAGQPVRRGETLVQMDDQLIRTQLEEAHSAASQGEAAQAQAAAELRRAHVEVESGRDQARAQLLQSQAALHKSENYTRAQELQSARAALEGARAEEEQAQRDAERFQRLLTEGALPLQQSERQKTALIGARSRRISAEQAYSLALEGQRREDRHSAEAQVLSARAGVNLANSGPLKLEALGHQVRGLAARAQQAQLTVEETRIQLERHSVRAPFNGRVLALYVQPGDLVNPGTPVARFGRVDKVKMTFGVPLGPRTRLRVGQTVTVKVEGRSLPGKVFSLGFEGDSKTHNFPVEVVVDNPSETLLPNMVARLETSASKPSRKLLLPVSSLASDGLGHFVYVIKEGAVHRRDVVLGSTWKDQVEIESGLATGQSVAAHPQRLTDGLKVSLK